MSYLDDIDELDAAFDHLLREGHLSSMLNSLDRIGMAAGAWQRRWLFPQEPSYYVYGLWCDSIRELGAP